MAQPSLIEPSRADDPVETHPRALELLRRIEELEALDESLGRFTRWDWLACVLIALVLPAAALLWFGR